MSIAVITTQIPSNSTDALFRLWGANIKAQLAAAGWVNTADTGQINWTTVLAPTLANTVQGYEIWRMADALQATVPIFLKLEYGSGSAAGNPAVWVVLGSGSTGAGALTGVLSTRQQVTGTLTATPCNWYISGDTNRFGFALASSAGNSFLLSIERTVDVSGVVTGEGALLIVKNLNSWSQVAWNQITGPYTATWELTIGALGPAVAPAGVWGTQLAVYPIYHNKGVFLNPGLNCLAYIDATIGAFSTISFSIYGGTHTYMTLGGTGFANPFRANPISTGAMMIRYE